MCPTRVLMVALAILCCQGCQENTDTFNDFVCGNGVLETGEGCDGTIPTNMTCATLLGNGAVGELSCINCQINTSACTLPPTHTCGNGIMDTGETCETDDTDLPTCASLLGMGYTGQVVCQNCQYDTSGCVIVSCGNGAIDADEECDTVVPWDKTCETQFGKGATGTPTCTAQCKLDYATCVPPENMCGNGVLDTGETCEPDDTDIPSCEYLMGVGYTGEVVCQNCQYDTSGCMMSQECGNGIVESGEACDDGNTQSKDGCSADCTLVETGRKITAMTWNVLFEYEEWGGKPVAPRAVKLHNILASYPTLPDFIALEELSPEWYLPDNFSQITSLGYKKAVDKEPDTTYEMFSQIVFLENKYNMLESGYKTLPATSTGELTQKKTCVTYAVLEDKETQDLFIAMATHWLPNDGVTSDMTYGQVVDKVLENEAIRIEGAQISGALVNELRIKYPEAQFFYGGDLNTFDLSILLNILNAENMSALASIFQLVDATTEIPDDYVGSHNLFANSSALLDARSTALTSGVAINDRPTTTDPGIPSVITDAGIPIVIDYAFFSPSFILREYEVMYGNDYDLSDHRPVRIVLEYFE